MTKRTGLLLAAALLAVAAIVVTMSVRAQAVVFPYRVVAAVPLGDYGSGPSTVVLFYSNITGRCYMYGMGEVDGGECAPFIQSNPPPAASSRK